MKLINTYDFKSYSVDELSDMEIVEFVKNDEEFVEWLSDDVKFDDEEEWDSDEWMGCGKMWGVEEVDGEKYVRYELFDVEEGWFEKVWVVV